MLVDAYPSDLHIHVYTTVYLSVSNAALVTVTKKLEETKPFLKRLLDKPPWCVTVRYQSGIKRADHRKSWMRLTWSLKPRRSQPKKLHNFWWSSSLFPISGCKEWWSKDINEQVFCRGIESLLGICPIVVELDFETDQFSAFWGLLHWFP